MSFLPPGPVADPKLGNTGKGKQIEDSAAARGYLNQHPEAREPGKFGLLRRLLLRLPGRRS